MAGWEEELAVLLRELRVAQDTPEEFETHWGPMQASGAGFSQEYFSALRRDEGKRKVQTTDAYFWGRTGSKRSMGDSMADETDADDALMSELREMRGEVNTIVSQVVNLMQHGDIDPALKEDVLVVLRALRRRASITQQAAASETAYLEFAAAMLHFCRLVLRISEVSFDEF